MRLEEIKVLAELMRDTGLTALEISEEGCDIKMERKVEVAAMPHPHPAAPSSMQVMTTTTPAGPVTEVKKPEEEGKAVTSPMVGVFYAAPDPGAEPFVSLGTRVKKGDVLCIVEAMKLMNEILAEEDGVITKISCTNGQTVEYGQELFRMKEA